MRFGNYARHAQIWKLFTGDRSDEIDFWNTLAKGYGRKILALMSATGEVSFGLANRGNQVTAVDITKNMIVEARQRYGSAASLEFVVGDVRSLSLPNKDYHFAFIGTASFHHLQTPEEQLQALQGIGAHTRLGGGLGLELWYPASHSWSTPVKQFEPLRSPTTGRVWKEGKTSFDADSNRVEIEQQVFIEKDGKRECFPHTFFLKLIAREEMHSLLRQANYEVINEFADYHQHPWSPKAATWIIEAKKVHSG